MKAGGSKRDPLIAEMDAFAADLMATAKVKEGAEAEPLETRLAVFQNIAKWIAVRNRLEDDGGSGIIDEYKSRLQTPAPREAAIEPPLVGRGAGTGSGTRNFQARAKSPANGGKELDAIKSRLPDRNAGGDERDRGAARSPPPPASGGFGKLRPRLPGIVNAGTAEPVD